MRRAVIVGAGAVSALGVGLGALFDGLSEGRSAVGPVTLFDASAFPARVAAEVPVPEADGAWLAARFPQAEGYVCGRGAPSGALRDRKVTLALAAALEAWRAAGCGEGERAAWLSLAVGLERAFLEDFLALGGGAGLDWSRDASASLPSVRYRATVDLPAREVAALLGLRGPVAVHASACAAGALSVSHAAGLVVRGDADVVVCGGTDSMVNPLGLGGMARLGATSPRAERDACRPFDRRRDGLVMGEGAAVFVVEEESRARARGARPLARVTGWGSTQDAWRATAPRPDGASAARAMTRALERARRAPEAVGYLNAHGTGTPLNDVAEARAIRAALGAHGGRVPVSSVKGALGHLMAASGAIEVAACLAVFARGFFPGTAGFSERDPEIDLDVIGEVPRRASAEVVLTNSFGFGGQNATLVLERAE